MRNQPETSLTFMISIQSLELRKIFEREVFICLCSVVKAFSAPNMSVILQLRNSQEQLVDEEAPLIGTRARKKKVAVE